MMEDLSGYGYVDEKVLIKSFEALANALGFKKKSFSTNDILGIESVADPPARCVASCVAIMFLGINDQKLSEN
jgi:hypothetical protein